MGEHRTRKLAKRQDVLMFDAADCVTIIGLDTSHKNRGEHSLWDPRVKDPVDEDLAKNILRYGVLKPVRARNNGGELEVVDGRRRTRSWRRALDLAKEQGVPPPLLPVWVIRDDDLQLLVKSRSANAFSKEDKPSSMAVDAQYMLERGMSLEDVAAVYGRKPGMVKQLVQLLNCSSKVLASVDAGALSVSAAARQMASLPREDQDRLLAQELKSATTPSTSDKPGKPGKPGKVTVKRLRDAALERSGKPVPRSPKVVLAEAGAIVRNAVAQGDGPGALQALAGLLRPQDARSQEARHSDQCWRIPGHHACAIALIEKLLEPQRD